jgi:hypothetical protein
MIFDRRALLLSPLALGLCGFTTQPMAQQWNGGHPESLDPTWNLLNMAKVAVDGKAGLMTAQFTDDLKEMAGKTVKIEGFMLPLSPAQKTIHFVLTRRNSGCPFCPPNQPTEAVEVQATRPIKMTNDLITISGNFTLQKSSDMGMFYQLLAASEA